LIDINELYQFAYNRVTPRQTPNISSTSQEGRIFIGLNPNPVIRSAQLPEQIQRAMQSEDKYQRQGVIRELSYLLKSPDPSMVLSAETALRKMVNDDSRSVADFAQDVLNQHYRTEAVPSQNLPVQEAGMPKSSVREATIGTPSKKIPVIDSPPKVMQISQAPLKKNVNLGGFLNVIIPGAAQAYVGDWGRALVTFIIVVVLLGAIVNIGDLTICASMLMIEAIYMFLAGRNIVIRYNKKLGSGT